MAPLESGSAAKRSDTPGMAWMAMATNLRVSQRADPEERQADAIATTVAGEPVPPGSSLQRHFGQRLGADLSGVRIHDDTAAHEAAQDLNAKAFTVGSDIHFGRGQLTSATYQGRALLAHEFVHTVQQRSGRAQSVLQRSETDTGVAGSRTGLRDGAPALNTEVNRRLGLARASLGSSSTSADLVIAAFEQLGRDNGSGFLTLIEEWANMHLPRRGGGPLSTRGTKYGSIPLLSQAGPMFAYLAPMVRLGNVYCGTDKIGHMFQQGFQYYVISARSVPTTGANVSAYGPRLGAGQGDDMARAWGEYMEGILSPAHRADPRVTRTLATYSRLGRTQAGVTGQQEGHFGLRTTGVGSRGDLHANDSGLRFYADLVASPSGYTFDILRYVTPGWDEEVSGNVYSPTIERAVRASGRWNSTDTSAPSATGIPMP